MDVAVGLCGASNLPSYAESFSVLEVQQTFYSPPQDATLLRWRSSVPDDFTFVVKAWQLLTHDARSPTYRRLRVPLSDEERQAAGSFRDTAVVERGWRTTLHCAELLRATAVLV